MFGFTSPPLSYAISFSLRFFYLEYRKIFAMYNMAKVVVALSNCFELIVLSFFKPHVFH